MLLKEPVAKRGIPASWSEATPSSFRYGKCILVILFLAVLLPFSNAFDKPALTMDEGLLLVYPERILSGDLPYRDFETFHGPANLYLLAGVYSVFSSSIFTERAVGLGYRLLILAAIFCLAKPWGRSIATGCAIVTGFVLLNLGVAAYSWMGAISCGLWSLCLIAGTSSSKRCFFGALLFVAATLFRPDLTPTMLLASIPLLLLLPRKSFFYYLLGLAAGLGPFLLFVAVAGPQIVLENLLLIRVFRTSGARYLPITSADFTLCCLLLAHAGATLCNLCAGIRSVWLKPQSPNARLLLAISLFSLGLLPAVLQRLDDIHVLSAAFLSLGFLPLALRVMSEGRTAGLEQPTKDWLATAATIAAVAILCPEFSVYLRTETKKALSGSSDAFFVERNGRTFPMVNAKVARMTALLLDYLNRHCSPGERLFVGPGDLRRTVCNDTFLYHMFPDLRPASYFLEMNPLSANRPGSRLASDIESSDWLILNRAWDKIEEPNASKLYGSDAPNRVIETKFQLCGEFGSFLLFHNSNRQKRSPALAQF